MSIFGKTADAASLPASARSALKAAAPDARIDAHGQWLRPVFDLIGTLRWLAIGLVAMLALASTASVVLSARSSFEAHSDTIDIMHLLGSTQAQIARLFQRRIALDAAMGALIGLLLAAAACCGCSSRMAARLDSGLVSAGSFGPLDWLLLATVPIAGIALAVFTARVDRDARAQEKTVIVRLLSSVLLAWILGFAWFAILLPQPLGDQQTDAVVVPTGGPMRIDRGLEALAQQMGRPPADFRR